MNTLTHEHMNSIDNRLKLAVLVLGFNALITQIIMLREFLSVFNGNELLIGIILANWMLLTGIGAYLGRSSDRLKNKTNFIIFSLVLIAVLPLISVFLLNVLKNVVFPVGSMVSFIQVLFYSFLLLLPFCFLAGFLFTLFCNVISLKTNLIAKVYSLEAIGGIAGGLLFNFILVYFLETFQCLTVVMIINLLVPFLLLRRRKIRYLIILLSAFFLFITFYFNLDNISKRYLYKNQEIILHKNTPYGNLVITKRGEQINFYDNNVLLFYTNNIIANEEDVHYAMVQHPDPKNILLISGGLSGTLQEILKYNVKKIDYIELNPWLIDIGREFTPALEDKKVNIFNKDARLFIKKTTNRYDVVLINLPEPSTAQINRFYTLEFFRELKRILNDSAVISLSLMSTANYLSDKSRQLSSILYYTLKKVFDNVLIVPGEKNYFLASDNDLSINIVQKIEEKGIENEYIQYYLDDRSLAGRNKYIESSLNINAAINRDFTPVTYYHHLLYSLSYFKINLWVPFGIILILTLFIVLRLNPVSLGLFTGGFAASSIEILLLISFQIIYGYVYQMLGIIITVFMAGLAIGALFEHKILRNKNINNYILIQAAIGFYAILLPIVLIYLKNFGINDTFIIFIFMALTLIISILVGMEFSSASKLQMKDITSVAAENYSVDLIGSAIGALVVTTLLIPLLGIINVSIIIGLLSFASGLVCYIKRKKL